MTEPEAEEPIGWVLIVCRDCHTELGQLGVRDVEPVDKNALQRQAWTFATRWFRCGPCYRAWERKR